jgi:hypothetical protein
MGDGDDLPTLAWRVSKLEQLLEDQSKDRVMIRLFTAGLAVNTVVATAGLLISAKVF